MRRWIALTAKLYPRAWRERYGVEFDALMEDVEADWRELGDVLGGAVKMQLKSETAYLKVAAVLAVIGAIAGAGLSFPMERYVSSAVLRINPAHGGDREAMRDLELAQQEILSRSSLAELITRRSLSLYRRERQRMPMEDVIQQMRRDIALESVPGDGPTVRVSFTYPDRLVAQAVARELTVKFVERNLVVQRNRAQMWQKAWHEDAPAGSTMEVVTPANNPRSPVRNLVMFVTGGIGVGAAIGLLAVTALRGRRCTLRLAAFAAAGCALAAAVGLLLPSRYTSSAVMRITPAMDPNRWYEGKNEEPASAQVQRLGQEVLSEQSLERIASKVQLNRIGAANMRSSIGIRMQHEPLSVGEAPSAFEILFICDDARQAQAVVRELVTGFTEQNILEERKRALTGSSQFRFMADHKLGENLEVLDPASLPQAPVWPNRLTIAAVGMTGGLLIGVVVLYLRRPRGRAMEQVAAT